MNRSYLKDPICDLIKIHFTIWNSDQYHYNSKTAKVLDQIETNGGIVDLYEDSEGRQVLKLRVNSRRTTKSYFVYLHEYTAAYANKKGKIARLDLRDFGSKGDYVGSQSFTPEPARNEYGGYGDYLCALTQNYIHGYKFRETRNPGRCTCKKCLADQGIDQA